MSQGSTDSEVFAKLWASFYDQAASVASLDATDQDLAEHRTKVATLLDAMIKLIFGLDENKKSIAVNYCGGSIELAIQLVVSTKVLPLVSSTSEEEGSLLIRGLKAIKCCVVRNPAGRSRCCSAGAFDFVFSVFEYALALTCAATLVEEALTTLAAMCLGDDLNALQGDLQMRQYVQAASTKFPEDEFPSMHQKVTYLFALFDAIEKEQATLIEDIVTNCPEFFNIVSACEMALRRGLDCQQKEEFQEAQTLYSSALSDLESLPKTPLLQNSTCQLQEHRSAVRVALGEYEGALADANTMLEYKLSPESTVRAQTLRAEALEGLGKKEEAREALSQALIASPENEAVQSKLQKLSLS